jgi:hypothetical protein
MNADHAEAAAAEAVRLRRQMEQGADDSWAVPLPAGLDTRLLHHLPPPAVPRHSAAAALEELDTKPWLTRWRTAFAPARCYYRRGPGFITVKDLREPGAEARVTIDQPLLIDAFLHAEKPVRLADETGDMLAALEFLLAERLLLAFGEILTTAPYRMGRWPIPARLA